MVISVFWGISLKSDGNFVLRNRWEMFLTNWHVKVQQTQESSFSWDNFHQDQHHIPHSHSYWKPWIYRCCAIMVSHGNWVKLSLSILLVIYSVLFLPDSLMLFVCERGYTSFVTEMLNYYKMLCCFHASSVVSRFCCSNECFWIDNDDVTLKAW